MNSVCCAKLPYTSGGDAIKQRVLRKGNDDARYVAGAAEDRCKSNSPSRIPGAARRSGIFHRHGLGIPPRRSAKLEIASKNSWPLLCVDNVRRLAVLAP